MLSQYQRQCPICNVKGNRYYDFLVVRNKTQGRAFDLCRECLEVKPHKAGTIGLIEQG